MPIYAYRCTSCGHAKDVLQKISDPALTVCPACGESTFAKQVTAAGFQLKGSGWYVTDFRNKEAGGNGKKPADGGDAKPADTGAADGAAAKTDAGTTAPAAKPAPAAPAAPAASAAPAAPAPKSASTGGGEA